MRLNARFLLAGTLASVAALTAVTGTAAATESKITILYDAFGSDAAMKKDLGFSALVEVTGKSDHMAGLSHVLSVNPKVKIYAPREGFGIYGSSLPSSFYRKDESLPPGMRYYDGRPPEIMKFGTAGRTLTSSLSRSRPKSLPA
jgi:7,8-dihydropterin-6-yl-methyl-4-(beta-D-ribofuranosyl)aminobenzene 5'-phosphate synthase